MDWQITDTLQLARPYGLLFVCLPLLMWALRQYCQKSRLGRYIDAVLMPWLIMSPATTVSRKVFSRNTAYVIAWLCFAIAAAGPRVYTPSAASKEESVRDVMIVLDVSRSMRANDTLPDRLKRARIELFEFMGLAPSNRLGIITYAARPHLLAPLTYDYELLSHYLELVDKVTLPTMGSDPVAALHKAATMLEQEQRASTVLWVTDADIDPVYEKPLEKLAQKLAVNKIPLYAYVVGSAEGEAIPLKEGGWLSRDGEGIVSRANIELVKLLTGITGGSFVTSRVDQLDWQELYLDNMAKIVTTASTSKNDARQVTEYYAYLLLPGILLVFIALQPYRVSVAGGSPVVLLCICTLLSLVPTSPGYAAGFSLLSTSSEEKAYAAFTDGRYAQAMTYYEQVPGFAGRSGQGASLFRMADYAGAIGQYSQAVLQADSAQQRATALFNLGNSYFKTGNYTNAIEVYADALRYQPSLEPAQKNLSLSMKLQEQVALRLRQQQLKTQRMGRGVRPGRAEEGADVTEDTRISFDDFQQQQADSERVVELDYEKLIQKGLEHANLSSNEIATSRNILRKQTLADAKIHSRTLDEDNALLWKRIFEIDEGFPAPLDMPARVEGVQPW